jgi:CubicO group peptidase (beta-lactamase class C family)
MIVRFALLLAFASAILGQDFDAIDRSATEELSQLRIPGAFIAIVKGDRIIYSKAFGSANVETGEPLRREMLFRLGSTTKMFTAAALVGLAVEGKIDLNASIGAHLGFLPPKLAAITANQLLSHTAGLHDEAPQYGSHDDSALATGIRTWTDDWLFTPPGRVFSYANPGYWCVGYLVETVTSKPYADAMESQLFRPLGMERTFRPTMAMTWPLAQGHELENEKPKIARPAADNASTWPAGSIFSNTRDLARFVIAFLNSGRLDGKQVLDPKTIALMASPHAEVPGEGSYGYGLFLFEWRGVHLVAHDGGRTGYASVIRMIPSQRVGVITLVNGSGEALPATTERALEAAASLGPADSKPKTTPTAFTATELRRIAGRYQNGKTRFELLARDGKLYLKQQNGSETELRRYGPSSFGANRPAFTLVASGTGEVDYLLNGDRAYARSN